MTNAPAAFVLPVAAVLLVLAALSGLTARRGWTNSLRRSGRLGLHSPAASASDDAFAVANRVAAPVLGGTAAMALVLAVLTMVLPLPVVGTVVIGGLAIGAVVIMLIAAGVVGEKAARAMPVPARRPGPSAGCDGCACGGAGCAGLTRSAAPADAGAGPIDSAAPAPAPVTAERI